MKTRVRLTLSQKYELADRLKATQNKKLSKRLLCISLRHYGYKISHISSIQGVSERTVTTWIQLFLEGGFDRLMELRYPRHRSSKLTPYLPAIKTWLAAHPHATLEDLQAHLQEQHGLEVEYSWLYRFLRKRELW